MKKERDHMFFIRQRRNDDFLRYDKLVEEVLRALAYSYFATTYTELSSYKTENRIERINEETRPLASATQKVSAAIEETASPFQVATTSQEEVNKRMGEGRGALNSALQQLQLSNNSISELTAVINELREHVGRIHKAVEVITQITEKRHTYSL